MAEAAPHCDARIDFYSIPDRLFPLAVLDAPSVLGRVMRSRADVIVLDSIAAAFIGPLAALRPPRLPLVPMLHQPPGGIDYGPIRTALQAVMDRMAYRKATRLMVASQSLADQLAATGVPRDLLAVVPPGRDVPVPQSTYPLDLRRGRRAAILCVGNWVQRKGIHWLLEAVARLPEDAGTLHLAGDDKADRRYARHLRERLARPDLAGRVVVHGPLSRGRVADLYGAADIFALPSVREPYGTVYGEAMAMGLPVVGWRAGNLPYLAEDERKGLLVPPGDLDGLTAALRRLVEDEALRKRLGTAAKLKAQSWPTWEESAALFFKTLREVVEGQRR